LIFSSSNIFQENLPKLKTYTVNFSLNRLVPGVDNIRYDVHLSPKLQESSTDIVKYLISRHVKTSEADEIIKNSVAWINVQDTFRETIIDVLLNATNKAKAEREFQIDFLVQASLTKMFLEKIHTGFEKLIEHYKNVIRKLEVSKSSGSKTIIRLKEELSETLMNRKKLTRKIAEELFQYLIEIQSNEIQKNREANFGPNAILPKCFFANPLINSENSTNDFFLIEEYVLFGNRLNDPLKYNPLIELVTNFYRQISAQDKENLELINEDSDISDSQDSKSTTPLSKWINRVDNLDTLLNYFECENEIKNFKKQKKGKTKLHALRIRAKTRKNRFNYLHKQLKATGMLNGIIAAYEMRQIYFEFCPPLNPLEVLKYIVSPKERNAITGKLRRTKGPIEKSISLKLLQKTMKEQKKIPSIKKKEHLISYLKDLVRYHRDLQNYNMLKEAMDWINLTEDEKTLKLSRINRTLYEFLHSSEYIEEEKPIVNHVIIKTDVRGSTDITHQIKERGLNPASYFSLNFFDPITAILSEYGAEKVFIEGDAIILSIFEKEGTPKDWYAVARACGLAINMLLITQRYNVRSKKHRLPILEQGVGICYRNTPPTYLFDGDNRIMISPAINLADRLSGCTKSLRKKFTEEKLPFNLYVFQIASDSTLSSTTDDLFSRYNINGIELNAEGFDKLKEEINLQKIRCYIPEIQKEKFIVYTGTFPAISGKYQRLVIREAEVPLISTHDFSLIRMTNRKYYEVCTNRKLYEFIKDNR